MTDLVDVLRSFSEAYPVEVFPPLADDVRAAIIREHPGAIDRISAGMGRHFAPHAAEAANELEQLRGNLTLAEEGLANYAQENERLKAQVLGLQNQLRVLAIFTPPEPTTAVMNSSSCPKCHQPMLNIPRMGIHHVCPSEPQTPPHSESVK
jgi:hypothetical protein